MDARPDPPLSSAGATAAKGGWEPEWRPQPKPYITEPRPRGERVLLWLLCLGASRVRIAPTGQATTGRAAVVLIGYR